MAQSRQKAIFFRARETLRTTTEWLFFSFRKNTWSKDHMRMFLPFCNFSQVTGPIKHRVTHNTGVSKAQGTFRICILHLEAAPFGKEREGVMRTAGGGIWMRRPAELRGSWPCTLQVLSLNLQDSLVLPGQPWPSTGFAGDAEAGHQDGLLLVAPEKKHWQDYKL